MSMLCVRRKFWDVAEREQQIRKALDAATLARLPGARWREDKALLATRW
jgi:hypothetical protein